VVTPAAALANTLVIVISQSGETADTLAAMRESTRLPRRFISPCPSRRRA